MHFVMYNYRYRNCWETRHRS